MFNQEEFSKILSKINSTYDTMTDFAKKASFDRTYISKYINRKLSNPPTPKILEKIAIASNGTTTYAELMDICGYLKRPDRKELKEKEYAKSERLILDKDFSPDELLVIKKYLLSDSSSPNYEKYFNDFEKMLTSIDDKKRDFLLSFCPKFLLNIGKQLTVISDETERIFSKSNIILDKTLDISLPQYYMCPVYGSISAGIPNWAEECIEGRLPIDPVLFNIINPEEHFFLRVNGESMNKVVRNGAYALIHKQDIVENGEIAVVLVNGDEATLKKFSKQGEFVVLEPISNDNSFQVQIYDKTTPIKILGKYVGKFEMNK